jgi:hypothetical protein
MICKNGDLMFAPGSRTTSFILNITFVLRVVSSGATSRVMKVRPQFN